MTKHNEKLEIDKTEIDFEAQSSKPRVRRWLKYVALSAVIIVASLTFLEKKGTSLLNGKAAYTQDRHDWSSCTMCGFG